MPPQRPPRFKLLGLDAERRPVILRLNSEGEVLERIREQLTQPRYVDSGWLAWAGVPCPVIYGPVRYVFPALAEGEQ
jgi:hypothetical protein